MKYGCGAERRGYSLVERVREDEFLGVSFAFKFHVHAVPNDAVSTIASDLDECQYPLHVYL